MKSRLAPMVRNALTHHAPLAILWIIAATCLVLDLAVARDGRVALTTIPLFLIAAIGTRRAMRIAKDHAYSAR